LGEQNSNNFQQQMFHPVLRAMQIGVRIDLSKRDQLILEVEAEIARREKFLSDILGHPLNPKSPKQMKELFYNDLKQPIIFTRAKKGAPSRPTLDDNALQTIASREPLLKPIINCISDLRTMGIFLSSFLRAPLDDDGRMRTAYNIGGSASGKSAPKTYRLSSSENAFGGGANLQTIPSEKSKSLGKAAARGATFGIGDPYAYPNLRSMFIPDPGHVFFDGDLDRADLQVVVWESDDELLKRSLRLGVDIHLVNACILAGKEPPPLEELVEGHSSYPDHRGRYKLAREFAKVFCHGTNYGGGARTMAANTGRTVQEIDRAQKIWFGAHPGIRRWHDRVKAQITRHHFIENRFGYRWYIFDRIDSVVPEAIAWIPQSTVSVVINRIWKSIHDQEPQIQVLLQTHDSLAGQFPEINQHHFCDVISACAKVTIPYEDPLVIPFSLKTSKISWGDC
jgi:DNA polymerase I-like protein with 3'-5' exonuclease and polymerase domains